MNLFLRSIYPRNSPPRNSLKCCIFRGATETFLDWILCGILLKLSDYCLGQVDFARVSQSDEIKQHIRKLIADPGLRDVAKTRVGDELADVLLYLIRLADACEIDLSQAVVAKLQKNATKYPVQKCFGSSAKYTTFQ